MSDHFSFKPGFQGQDAMRSRAEQSFKHELAAASGTRKKYRKGGSVNHGLNHDQTDMHFPVKEGRVKKGIGGMLGNLAGFATKAAAQGAGRGMKKAASGVSRGMQRMGAMARGASGAMKKGASQKTNWDQVSKAHGPMKTSDQVQRSSSPWGKKSQSYGQEHLESFRDAKPRGSWSPGQNVPSQSRSPARSKNWVETGVRGYNGQGRRSQEDDRSPSETVGKRGFKPVDIIGRDNAPQVSRKRAMGGPLGSAMNAMGSAAKTGINKGMTGLGEIGKRQNQMRQMADSTIRSGMKFKANGGSLMSSMGSAWGGKNPDPRKSMSRPAGFAEGGAMRSCGVGKKPAMAVLTKFKQGGQTMKNGRRKYDFGGSVGNFFKKATSSLAPAANVLTGGASGAFRQAAPGIGKAISDVGSAAGRGLQKAAPMIGQAASTVSNGVGSALQSASPMAGNAFGQTFGNNQNQNQNNQQFKKGGRAKSAAGGMARYGSGGMARYAAGGAAKVRHGEATPRGKVARHRHRMDEC